MSSTAKSKSIPVFETCKKRKRMPKLFALHAFGEAGCPMAPKGEFRDNIRGFLRECAEMEDYTVQGMPIWCTLLVSETNPNFIVPLYTIQEHVDFPPASSSPPRSPSCDQCRCTGWGHHFLSKRKYHMIIPLDDDWNKPLNDGVFDLQTHLLHGLIHCNGFGHLLCINGVEGGSKFLSGREIMDLWDRICGNLRARKITVEDVSKKGSMELRLLHGVAYGQPWFGRWGYKFCRGNFGVTQQNYERAIQVLSSLQLNKIVHDFAAITTTTNTNSNKYREIRQIICYYRSLSDTQLITLGHLLRFMLSLKTKSSASSSATSPAANSVFPRPSTRKTTTLCTRNKHSKKHVLREKSFKCRNFSAVVATMDSRWPVRRLEYAAEVIVNALKEKRPPASSSYHRAVSGMTRQEVRDAARLHIGDTGLLDYVLKSMNNVIVGDYIVYRAVNPSNRVLEYTIRELQGEDSVTGTVPPHPEPEVLQLGSPEAEGPNDENINVPVPDGERTIMTTAPARVAGADTYRDMLCLYTNVLMDYPEAAASEEGGDSVELIDLATRVMLDSKHFVKEWPFRDEDDQLLRFICRVMPGLGALYDIQSFNKTSPAAPGEVITVPLHATIGEVKRAAEAALRDTYCIMEQFVAAEIQGLDGMEDSEVVFGAIESGSEVWIRGYGLGSGLGLGVVDNDEVMMMNEGGTENWTVKCDCGANDDDGERMVACDVCEVWQHTRCIGIDDLDAVPPLFVCAGCCASLLPQRPPQLMIEPSGDNFGPGYF